MNDFTQFFKALSEPVRLRLINLLLTGERCVCELMEVLDMPQSSVSRHLAVLKNAGIVCDRRQGVWKYYRLTRPATPGQQEIMTGLGRHLPEDPQSKFDLHALHHFEKSRKSDTCR
jgi:ArsR family transcriptional regulator